MKSKAIETVKKAAKPAIKFAAAGVGIAGSAYGLKQLDKVLPTVLPASLPDWVRKLAPGLITIVGAILATNKVSDERLKALLMGVGGGGAIDIIRKFLPAEYQDKVVALSGAPGYAAVATQSPGYEYYLRNSLQGSPYALNGDTTTSMQGAGGSMSPYQGYALNGVSMQGAPYILN